MDTLNVSDAMTADSLGVGSHAYGIGAKVRISRVLLVDKQVLIAYDT